MDFFIFASKNNAIALSSKHCISLIVQYSSHIFAYFQSSPVSIEVQFAMYRSEDIHGSSMRLGFCT